MSRSGSRARTGPPRGGPRASEEHVWSLKSLARELARCHPASNSRRPPALESVLDSARERARRNHMRSSERGLEVVKALLVEGVEQIELELGGNPVGLETRSEREAPDRA